MNKIMLAKNLSVSRYDEQFQTNFTVAENINLSFNEKTVNALTGLNESSLSQILKVLAGIERPSAGEVNTGLRIGFLPTENFTFPWMNVFQNIQFGNEDKSTNDINRIIDFIGLKGYEEHFPKSKSYGFLFRVGFARLLLHGFDILILDNPFAKIQMKSKFDIYDLLIKSKSEMNQTILFSSEDIQESVLLSDYIYYFADGGKEIEEEKISFESQRNISLFLSHEFIKKVSEFSQSVNMF